MPVPSCLHKGNEFVRGKLENYFHVLGKLGFSKHIGMIKGSLDFSNVNDIKYLTGLLRKQEMNGNTPIMSAANNNHNESFTELLSIYCDVNLDIRSLLKKQNLIGEILSMS